MCIRDRSDVNLLANVSNGLAPYEFAWTGPNGFSSNVENPVLVNVDASHTGLYSLIVTDDNGCISQAAAVAIDIADSPDAPVFSNPGPICYNDALELNVQVYSGTSVTYHWIG